MRAKPGILLAAGLVLAGSQTLQAQRSHNGGGLGAAAPVHVTARPAIPNLGGTPFPYRSTVATPTGLNPPAASYTGIAPGALRSSGNRFENRNGNRYGNNGHGNNSYGRRDFAPVYAGFYGVPYLPFADDSSYYSFPSYREQAEAVSAQASAQDTAQMQDAMAQEMDRMNYEIRQLRDSQMQMGAQLQPGGAPASQVYGPTPGPLASGEPQTAQVPITLVMQNGAKVSVNNYAVMNDVIWDFSKQPARKIPVSTINVSASEKATQENGGEFPALTASR